MNISEEFVRFRTIRNNVSFYFSGYPDKTKKMQYIADGKDGNGNDIMKKFSFAGGVVTIHKSNKQEIKHMEESPYCKGSFLNELNRETVYYIKVDPEGDAAIKLEETELAATSVSRALEICQDPKAMPMIAALCGATSGGESIQKLAIMDFARNTPEQFLKLTDEKNTPTIEYEAFIKQCVARGTLQDAGGQIMFHGEPLGKTVGAVIKKFSEQPDWLRAVQLHHEEMGGATSAAKPKRATAGGPK